jgi:tripartite-type tricarboxylate transporter receptor subunit TctC
MGAMRRIVISIFAMCLAAVSGAQAADWPSQPIHIVSPYPPAGATDRVARVLADYMSQRLNTPVVVDIRVGGASAIGTMQVVRSEPDGYTLLLSGIAIYVIAPTMKASPVTDPLGMLSQIGYLGGSPTVMVVSSKSDIHSIADIKRAEAAGRKFLYSSVGVGSLGNMVGEATNHDAGLHMTHVPYTTLNLVDVAEGRVNFGLFVWTSVQGLVESGDLRVVAVSSRDRPAIAPDVPTFKEQGVNAEVDAWLALSGPKGLPPAVVDKLHAIVVDFLHDPAIRQKLSNDILEWRPMSLGDFDSFIRQQIDVWQPRIRAAEAGRDP